MNQNVAVIGPSAASAQEERHAEQIGAEIARRGWTLVCGGRDGVMAAACRGAKEEGGLTIGLLPGSDASEANAWVDVVLPTGLGEGRNLAVALSGHAVVVLGLSPGTLAEIGFAARSGRPLIGLGIGPPIPDVPWFTAQTVAQAASELARVLGQNAPHEP